MSATARRTAGGPRPIDLRQRPKPVANEEGAIFKALTRIAAHWRLTNEEAAALAGMTQRSWSRVKDGTFAGRLSQDQRMRASLMVGLFKGLRILFDGPLTDGWPKLKNAGFGNDTPVRLMMEGGIPAMIAMRRHVDALRGGA